MDIQLSHDTHESNNELIQGRNDQNFIEFVLRSFKKHLPRYTHIYLEKQYGKGNSEEVNLSESEKKFQSTKQSLRKIFSQPNHKGFKEFRTIFGDANQKTKERNKVNRLILRTIISDNFLSLVFDADRLQRQNYKSFLKKLWALSYQLLDVQFVNTYHQQ